MAKFKASTYRCESGIFELTSMAAPTPPTAKPIVPPREPIPPASRSFHPTGIEGLRRFRYTHVPTPRIAVESEDMPLMSW